MRYEQMLVQEQQQRRLAEAARWRQARQARRARRTVAGQPSAATPRLGLFATAWRRLTGRSVAGHPIRHRPLGDTTLRKA